MEPAKIDWKRIDSIFVEDVFYEHIRAPKWFDFLAPENGGDSVDDDAWFCRPGCNHPKTAEDFLRTPPPASSKLKGLILDSCPLVSFPNFIDLLKLPSNSNVNEILPLQDRNQRDTKLKRRGQIAAPSISNQSPTKDYEDSENQNPNLSTPPTHQAKSWKAAFKSSSVKKKNTEEKLHNDEAPRLKSTLSARNLFSGKDILGHISEFCNELKKLATRARERESEEKLSEKKSQVGQTNDEAACDALRELVVREKERKPLLEVSQGKCDEMDKGSSAKEKSRRKKRIDDAENIPISLNLENVKHKGEERLLQIRTNPPSPQCFSVTRGNDKTTTPSKASRSKLMERGILQEVELNKELKMEEQQQPENKSSQSRSISVVDGREARALDVFWFLKPCTLAN